MRRKWFIWYTSICYLMAWKRRGELWEVILSQPSVYERRHELHLFLTQLLIRRWWKIDSHNLWYSFRLVMRLSFQSVFPLRCLWWFIDITSKQNRVISKSFCNRSTLYDDRTRELDMKDLKNQHYFHKLYSDVYLIIGSFCNSVILDTVIR